MQSNLSVQAYKPAFKANIAESFMGPAEEFFRGAYTSKKYTDFYKAVKRYGGFEGSDNVTIGMRKIFADGKRQFILEATEQGKAPVILTAKDQFRKVVDKFMHMNEYEFNLKLGKK